MTLKNPFAIFGGHVLHVDQTLASSGPYSCPSCSGRLIYVRESKPHSRTGTRRRAHFAHHDADCAHGLETGLHLWAKRLIGERKELTAPDFIVTHLGRNFAFTVPLTIAEARVEVWQEGLRPDLLLVDPDGAQTHVEIFVTHRVNAHKEMLLEERNVSSLEIDVSGFRLDAIDDKALAAAILHSAPRHWVSHARAQEWEAEAVKLFQVSIESAAQSIAHTVQTPPAAGPRDVEITILEDLITDFGLEPFVGRDVGGGHWFDLSPRHWQAKLLKTFVLDDIGQTGAIAYALPPAAWRFTIYDAKRDPKLLPLVQPWPGQRTDIIGSDPYVIAELEERHPEAGSPRKLARRYFETLISEPDRVGHPIGRRIIERADRSHAFRIYRPWADYVLRKEHLRTAFLKAGRRRPLGQAEFRSWYQSRLPMGPTPRAITVQAGGEYVRLLARLDAINNMLAGGWAVDDLMGIEEERFRDQMRARPVQPLPTAGFQSQPRDVYYCCTSMSTLEACGGDILTTLVQIVGQRLGVGADAFLDKASGDLGKLTPLEFAVDVPTMQHVIDRLPPPPGKAGRRRLW